MDTKHCAGQCPKCGSKAATWDDECSFDGTFTLQLTCSDCHTHYQETYEYAVTVYKKVA